MLQDILLFSGGLILLIYGSNLLIQSCVKLSLLARLTPFFIGIIFVAFGTSVPELSVSIIAAIRDEEAIALGNIVGSNISNIGLILGLCGLVRPLTVSHAGVLMKELPFMLLAAVLLCLLSLDGVLGRIDGLIFIGLFISFIIVAYRGAKLTDDTFNEAEDFRFYRLFRNMSSKGMVIFITLFFVAVVYSGAHLMIVAGISVAARLGIDKWLVAIIVFAIGTSLPELGASMTAALRKMPSISISNIIGSNVFNILLGLGIVALIRPLRIPDASVLRFEMPILIIFTAAFYIMLIKGLSLTRIKSLILFTGYILFLAFLIIK